MANLKQHKLGWIGIGRMGYAMAERLAKAGCDISVWNKSGLRWRPLPTFPRTCFNLWRLNPDINHGNNA